MRVLVTLIVVAALLGHVANSAPVRAWQCRTAHEIEAAYTTDTPRAECAR